MFACTVESAPSWPVLSAVSRSSASGAADLTDHDPVGPHSERVSKQVADRHLPAALDRCRAALEPDDVRLAQPELGRILDRDHPLVAVDPGRESVEQGRLPDPGTARDEDAAPRAHGVGEQVADLGRQGPGAGQCLGVGAPGGEAPDRQCRPVDRQRRDHDIDPRAVGEPCVGHRIELVDSPADRGEDPLDRVAQSTLGVEAHLAALDSSTALDVDRLVAVDHHLLDLGIREQLLQRAEPDGVAKDQIDDLLAPSPREDRGRVVDELAHRRLELARRLTGARRGTAPLDEPQPQVGGENACVIVRRGDIG